MTTFTKILTALDLKFIPDGTFTHPFGTGKTDDKNKSPDVDIPNNLRLTKDKGVPVLFGDVEDWDTVGTVKEQKSPVINDNDKHQIKELGLSVHKYQEVKTEWAKELSISDISKRFKGVRGYGKRTIATYISAINKANAN